MSEQVFLSLTQIATLFDVHVAELTRARKFLAGFPVSHRVRGKPCYLQHEIQRWADGKDIKALVKAARKYERMQGRDETSTTNKFIALNLQFAAGEFATPDQKQTFAMQRLVARVTKPKTTRVRVVSDWMMDDDKPNRRRAHG